MTVMAGGLDRFFRTVETVDPVGASDIVLELLYEGASLAQITREVLGPSQVRVGQRWDQGAWSVADVHAATAVTETALAALTLAGRARPGPGAGARHVIMACAEGEWHALPARMVAAVADTGDVRVTVLGPSLPADQLGRRLAAGDVDLVALSCTMPSNLLGAARCIQAAHAHGVPVLAGGRAFGADPRRAEAIGADSWAPDGSALSTEAPDLAGRVCDIPAEVLLLDAVDDSVLALAYERAVGAFPRLSQQTPYQQQRTLQDLRWMARFTAAAVLTDDRSVIGDLLSWLRRVRADRVPTTVITTSAHLLAETVEPFAPHGAATLHGVAAKHLDQAGAAR